MDGSVQNLLECAAGSNSEYRSLLLLGSDSRFCRISDFRTEVGQFCSARNFNELSQLVEFPHGCSMERLAQSLVGKGGGGFPRVKMRPSGGVDWIFNGA